MAIAYHYQTPSSSLSSLLPYIGKANLAEAATQTFDNYYKQKENKAKEAATKQLYTALASYDPTSDKKINLSNYDNVDPKTLLAARSFLDSIQDKYENKQERKQQKQELEQKQQDTTNGIALAMTPSQQTNDQQYKQSLSNLDKIIAAKAEKLHITPEEFATNQKYNDEYDNTILSAPEQPILPKSQLLSQYIKEYPDVNANSILTVANSTREAQKSILGTPENFKATAIHNALLQSDNKIKNDAALDLYKKKLQAKKDIMNKDANNSTSQNKSIKDMVTKTKSYIQSTIDLYNALGKKDAAEKIKKQYIDILSNNSIDTKTLQSALNTTKTMFEKVHKDYLASKNPTGVVNKKAIDDALFQLDTARHGDMDWYGHYSVVTKIDNPSLQDRYKDPGTGMQQFVNDMAKIGKLDSVLQILNSKLPDDAIFSHTKEDAFADLINRNKDQLLAVSKK